MPFNLLPFRIGCHMLEVEERCSAAISSLANHWPVVAN